MRNINDDEYDNLIDNYKFHNVIHNIYLDHLDHSDDSKFHHHHLTAKDGYNDNLDFIHHQHDDPDRNHDHLIGLVNHTSDVHEYGPADHDHSDDGATEHGTA